MNNVSYEIPLKRESLGIPTLDRCIKLLPFKIDTNFYYLPDGALYFTTLKDFHNKNHAIPAPQVHEMKACIRENIGKLAQKVDVIFNEDFDGITASLFISKKGDVKRENVYVVFSDDLSNDYADFLIKLFDKTFLIK